MRSLIQRGALVLGAVVGLLGTRPTTANAQKALVYCPVSIDATGCNAIVTALTGPAYPLGVDRGYDGTNGTVDLKTVDLFTYSVFVVPSLADDATSQPYAKLRDPEVVEHLKAALIGRIAMWSGTPDQGATNRAMKDALIQNLAGYAGGAFGTAKGPGLVALLDMSSNASGRYDWVRAITPVQVTADAALLIYNSVRALNQRATSILTSASGAIVYDNMATFGFEVPNGAAGVMLDAVGQTGTSVGGQVVLLTMEAGNSSGAIVKTDKDDYAPGTTVVITGSGWAANETVKLTLHMDPLRDADTELTATADDKGNFTNTDFAPKQYDIGVRFVLTAVGQASGRRAQTTFTDNTSIKTVTVLGAQTPNPINPGGSATYGATAAASVSVFFNGNGTCTAALTAVGLPSGASATFAPASLTGGNQDVKNALLTVSTTAGVPTGTHTFHVHAAGTAGDCVAQGEDSPDVTLVIGAPAAVSTALSLSAPSPASVPFGSPGPVTLSATLTTTPGATPVAGASVAFTVDGSSAGSATTNGSGVATLSTYNPSALSVNSHNVQASFTGATITGTTYNASTSGTQTLTVTQASTTTALTSAPNPSSFGQSATFTATVTVVAPGGGTPTGNVDFKEGATTLGSGSLSTVGGVQQATFSTTTLTVGTHNVTATYVGSTNHTTSTSSQVAQVVNPLATTLTVDPATGTYGGNVDLKATLKTGSTPLAGKTITFTLNGTICGNATTDANGEAKLLGVNLTGINAGTYPAGPGSGVQADFTGEATLSASTASNTLTVNKRLATWTTNPASKTYGDADPSPLTTGSAAAGGFLASDGVTATYARAAGETVAGGPYHITATLSATPMGALNNYTITNAGADFTINKRAATWTTSAASKTYGDADPSPLTTGLGSNFVAADAVNATYTRAPGETVAGGPYHITATLSSSVANALDNYTITNAGASFTINKRLATWTTNPSNKTYGDADPSPLTTGNGTNFVAADGVSALYSRAAGETVAGGPYHITATLSATVANALDNYTVTNTGADFTINKRLATWSTNPSSKTYGDADPSPLTSGSGTNFISTDGVTATYARAAGETVTGGPYHITATLASTVTGALDNYTITNNGADFTINKRNATWTTNPGSKTYGDADPSPLTTGSGSNFVAADNVAATYARAPGETVGSYHITATLVPAGVLGNYNITNAGAEFTINRRVVTWTTNPASKTYGDADPSPLTTGSGTNFVAADNVTATYSRAPGENAAIYHITAALAPAAVLANYDITNDGADFTIKKRDATWTTNPNSKTYGDPDPTPLTTGSGSNFVAGDNVTATYTRAPGETVTASPYAITANLSSTVAGALNNYNITNNGAAFTINKRAATWTTNPASKTYGDADPSPLTGGSGSNFVAADGISATYSRAVGENAGTYHITATLTPAAVLTNYDITNTGADFTINKRNATWTTDPNSKTYGDADPTPLTTGSGANFVAGDGVSATYTRDPGETVAGGPYHITANLTATAAGALDNYIITNTGASFTINKRDATWTTNANNKIYGDADPSPLTTGSGSNFVAADGISATYSRAAGENVGTYHITATLAPLGVLGNYNITNAGAEFTIKQRPATWTTNPNSKTYGDADPTPLTTGGAVAGGFLVADGVTATYTRAPGETVVGGPYHITATLNATVSGALANYLITNNGASFTINAKPLTVTTTATPNAVNYPTSPTLGVTYGAFALGENPSVLGAPPTLQVINTASVVTTPPYPPGTYTVKAVGLSSTNYALNYSNATFTVSNDAPVIATVTGPDPVATGSGGTASATVTVGFTDAGVSGDAYAITSSWLRSGSSTPVSVNGTLGTYNGTSGTASITATGLVVGVYTVTVTVTDKFNAASAPYDYRYVVVYDPNGGFVTGGGWIDSPAGAYVANPSLSGKANFGFVAKYQKGQSQPGGDTEFQFHAASMNFKSRSYDWLVINGTTKAQFKGVGTINGSGNYGFILTSIDGDNFGSKKPDMFRIKIWDIATSVVVYDNNITVTDELADPTTVIAGGSIQIKTK
jgi:hypothetical protein